MTQEEEIKALRKTAEDEVNAKRSIERKIEELFERVTELERKAEKKKRRRE